MNQTYILAVLTFTVYFCFITILVFNITFSSTYNVTNFKTSDKIYNSYLT